MEQFQTVGWYTSKAQQYHNKERGQGQILPVYAPGGDLPPFQIPVSGATATLKLLRLQDDVQEYSVAASVVVGTDYNMAIYAGGVQVVDNGLYYYTLTSGATTLYSDVIAVVDNSGFMKIEYWDEDDLTLPDYHFSFDGGFKFRVYLRPTSNCLDVMGKPQYFYEETIHRRAGYNFAESIVSGKRYVFESIVSEPVMDGLRLIKLCSFIEITGEGITKEVHDVNVSPTWDAFGYHCIAVFEFDTDTIVKTIGKARS